MSERDVTDANLARLAARIGGYWTVAKAGPEGRYLVKRMPALAAMLDEADRLDRIRERQTVRDEQGRDTTA